MKYNEKDRKLTDVTLQGAVVALLVMFNQLHDKDHSLQYTLEDCLADGIKAKQRSKEYGAATQNRKKFEAEIAADPTVVLDPKRMAALCRKFGIGAQKAEYFAKVETGEAQVEAELVELAKAEAAAAKTA